MPPNRRNYYRLLHVQSDAPAEVIKASYRALMALNHPDKGGDHAAAVLVNEAYAVLSDPARRQAYDAKRAASKSRQPFRDGRQASAAAAASATADRTGAASRADAKRAGAHQCPLCHLLAPAVIQPSSRCQRCRSPLAPVVPPSARSRTVERRAMPRVSKSDWALLYVDWPSEVIDIRMRDLSLEGISVYCGTEVPLHRTVRVAGSAFDVVAEIVSCQRVGKVFSLHARLVTALFTAPTGGFVSTTA